MTDDIIKDKWPQRLIELLEVVEQKLEKHGVSIAGLSDDIVIGIADHLGGLQTYLPKGAALRTALRDREIFRKHRQGNADQLAREYGLTEAQIYNIVKTQYKLHQNKIQPSLF